MTTTKWYFLSPDYLHVPWPRMPDLNWLKDRGWGVILFTLYDDLQPGTPLTSNFDLKGDIALPRFSDLEIPVMLWLNEIFYSVGSGAGYDPNLPDLVTTMGLPPSYYADKYGALFTAIEDKWGPDGSEGSCLIGYWQESCCDSAAEWLREQTDLVIRQGIYHTMWQNAGVANTMIGNGHETQASAIERRVSMVDAIDIELWVCDDVVVYDLIGCASYIRGNYPAMPIGINSISFNGPTSGPDAVPTGIASIQWNIHADGDGMGNYPFSVQTRRFYQATKAIKDQLGGFDSIATQTSNGDETALLFDYTWPDWTTITNPTWWDDQVGQLQLWDSMNLDSEGTKHIYDLTQNGIEPYYSGASYCAHNTTKTDTFTNTGNELILLKDYSAASTHDITVTSSLDPLTNTPYTIALSPDRGTIIGPYPLDDYGALPTIEYDNPNLYVSILKVEASA